MRSYRTSVAAFALLLVASSGGVAFAQPPKGGAPAQSRQARGAELYKKASDAYRQGKFQEAVSLLEEARGLDPQPVLTYNLARAYEGLGDISKAADFYERYLQEDPNAPDRGAIEQRAATLRKQLEDRAALEKQRDEERKRAEQAAREREEQRRREEASRPPPHKRSFVPYVVMGVGVAAAGTGLALGIVANGKHDDAVTEPVQAKAVGMQDDARSLSTIANVALIGGGVLVAGGLVWWILDAPKEEKRGSAPVRVSLGPGSLLLSGSFQ